LIGISAACRNSGRTAVRTKWAGSPQVVLVGRLLDTMQEDVKRLLPVLFIKWLLEAALKVRLAPKDGE
jgi:hypothetical protein